jgi:hypothetical protein
MKKQLRWILLLIGLTGILSAGQVLSQNSGEIQWSSPLLLGDGWWQSIAIDRQGEVHIGWYGGSSPEIIEANADVFNYTRRSLDGVWTPINNVLYAGAGGFTIRNAMAVTSDGTLHLAFRQAIYHAFSSVYGRTASNAQDWSPPVAIDTTGYYVNMIADDNDVLHLVTSERLERRTGEPIQVHAELNPCALCHNLFYRRSTDAGQSWSEPYPISLGETTGSDRMDIFEGQNGRLYIDWDEGYDWYIGRGYAQDVRIVYSDDAGLTWSDPIILDGGNLVDRKPIQIAATELRDRSLLAVWRYSTDADRNIYYQVSSDTGETWTAPQAIPGIVAQGINDSSLDDYNLVIDKIGAVHLFAVGQPDLESKENASLYDVVYRQGVWTPAQRIYFNDRMRPEWPKAVLGPQNDIHLVWFARGTHDEFGRRIPNTDILKVYYSHLPGIFPLEATQAFNPTRTPYPTATAFQNLEPTPTPFPTIEVVDTNVSVRTEDQYASQTLAGGIFAATAFCAGIFLFIRFRRGG